MLYPPLPWNSRHRDPNHRRTPECDLTAWMHDSGAGVAGFNDPYGLGPTYQLSRPVIIGGIVNSTNLSVTTGSTLDNINVLFDKRFGANCLPTSAIVDAGWSVDYHRSSDSYQVKTPSGRTLGFHRHRMANGAITKHYICHPQLEYVDPSNYSAAVSSSTITVAATSVQGNLAMHTPQDVKAAKTAYRLLTNMGGSTAHGIARLPHLRGALVTADHVRKAIEIYGPVRSHVQGSATSVQDTTIVHELPSTRQQPVPQSLAVDLCHILGNWFVVGLFLRSHYLVTAHVNNHTGPVIFAAIKSMTQAALKRNFDVLQIQADGEKGIHSPLLEEYCADKKIKLLKVGAGQHEPSVERITRTLKAEVRGIGCRLVPSALTNDLLVQLIIAATTSINYRLTSALTGPLSPQQIWFGDPHIHMEDIDYTFGDLALAKCPNQKNCHTILSLSHNSNHPVSKREYFPLSSVSHKRQSLVMYGSTSSLRRNNSL